jgi:xylan 1,4-beta-xylosidase
MPRQRVLPLRRLSKSQLQTPEKYKFMLRSFMRHLCIVGLGFLAVSFASLASAQTSQNALREVAANVKDTRGPVDRFFDLSIGSDYPGTLTRDDSQA